MGERGPDEDPAEAKRERQRLVAELLDRNEVHSQPQLAALLEVEGVRVAQATLSRDLHELGAIKTAGGYRRPESSRRIRRREDRTVRVARPTGGGLLGTGVSSVTRSGSIIVLRTEPGQAAGIARRIDEAGWHGILGTIAGHDTIFMVAVSGSVARSLETRLLGSR